MKKNPARDYLHLTVNGATPLGLVVLLYDICLDAIYRALQALKEGDTEQRTAELNRAILALGELQASLDVNRGGEVAVWLGRFYSVARGKLLEAQIKASAEILRQLAEDLFSVRDAWQQIEKSSKSPSHPPEPAPAGSDFVPGNMKEDPVCTRWSA